MENQLITIFGQTRVSTCLSTSVKHKEFLVADDEETSQSYIVPEENSSILEEECFKILNPQSKEIKVLSIDACFLIPEYGYNEQKCDCAIFSNDKFCFVELKTNASSRKKITDNIKKAIKQLGKTINYFDDNNIDFTEYELEAYVVLKPRLYRTSPAALTSKQERRRRFFDEFEVDLFEDKETKF